MKENKPPKNPSLSCRRCSRALTDPDSIARGYGPECWGKISVKDAEYATVGCARLDLETSQKIFAKIPKGRRRCNSCNTLLRPEVWAYDHEGGWPVEGKDKPQWLFLLCPKCGVEWSLNHLGYRG